MKQADQLHCSDLLCVTFHCSDYYYVELLIAHSVTISVPGLQRATGELSLAKLERHFFETSLNLQLTIA